MSLATCAWIKLHAFDKEIETPRQNFFHCTFPRPRSSCARSCSDGLRFDDEAQRSPPLRDGLRAKNALELPTRHASCSASRSRDECMARERCPRTRAHAHVHLAGVGIEEGRAGL